ncbi:uncharacterized protein LOC124193721 [Daphnia pulex]|uniref:uncharacterized protein LOC124193721 n=1 Tax=Daphnia pulex TaxID=6669 RepID=UPI001EE13ACF|nr:uncharacterized protein LOC124193721 [Daphnia pulex]
MADSKHFLTCFICGTFEIENKKFAAFGVTFERFSEWKDKVKGLKIGSKLCQVHFDSEDIIKGKYIFNQFYPLKVYRLSKDAIPKHFLSTNKSGDKKTRTIFPEKNVSSTEIACRQSNEKSQPLLSKNVIAYKSKYSKTNHQSSTDSSVAPPCRKDPIDDEAQKLSCSSLNKGVSQVNNEASPAEQLLAVLEDHNYKKRESTLSELDKEIDGRFLGNDLLSLVRAPVITTTEDRFDYSLHANESSLTSSIQKSNDPSELVIDTCLNNEIAVLQSSLIVDTVPQCTITTKVKKRSCPTGGKNQLPSSLYTCSNCKSKVSCKCCKILVAKYEALLLKMGTLKRKLKAAQQREKRIKEREKINMLVNHQLKSKIEKLKAGQLNAQIADLTDQSKSNNKNL